MKVQITAEDILHGKRYSCWDCPVARAMSRAAGREIAVAGMYWHFVSGEKNIVKSEDRRLPEYIARFVRHFDAGDLVEPCEFEVEI